jgi:hypothetical protein
MSLGRVLLISLAVLAVGFGLWRYWWTALDHHPEQDACSFGPVTNQEYRQMLARVKALQAEGKGVWAPLHGPTRSHPFSSPPGPPGVPEQLAARMNELGAGMTSLHERRMVMHAVMRAAGAYLHDSRLFGRNDHSRDLAANRIPERFVSATYVMHSKYRGEFLDMLLLAPFGAVDVHLIGQYEPAHFAPKWWQPNNFQANGHAVSVIGRFLANIFLTPPREGVYILRMPPAEQCLLEPDARVAEIYENWARAPATLKR